MVKQVLPGQRVSATLVALDVEPGKKHAVHPRERRRTEVSVMGGEDEGGSLVFLFCF